MRWIEKLGRYAEKPMYLVLLALFPLFCILFYLSLQFHNLKDISQQFQQIQQKIVLSHEVRMKKKQFLKEKKSFDPYFINKELENIHFLSQEFSELQKILHPPISGCLPHLKTRFDFLNENCLHFKEEKIQVSPLVKETEEIQMKPIEVDVNDLQKLLSRIEGVEIADNVPLPLSPQLFITKFHLERKQKESPQTYLLKVHLLKREFHD